MTEAFLTCRVSSNPARRRRRRTHVALPSQGTPWRLVIERWERRGSNPLPINWPVFISCEWLKGACCRLADCDALSEPRAASVKCLDKTLSRDIKGNIGLSSTCLISVQAPLTLNVAFSPLPCDEDPEGLAIFRLLRKDGPLLFLAVCHRNSIGE